MERYIEDLVKWSESIVIYCMLKCSLNYFLNIKLNVFFSIYNLTKKLNAIIFNSMVNCFLMCSIKVEIFMVENIIIYEVWVRIHHMLSAALKQFNQWLNGMHAI